MLGDDVARFLGTVSLHARPRADGAAPTPANQAETDLQRRIDELEELRRLA